MKKIVSKKKDCSCPNVDLKKFDFRMNPWDKTFYSVHLPLFFHMPMLDFGKVISRCMDEAVEKGYKVKQNGMLLQKDGFFNGLIMTEIQGTKKEDKKNLIRLKGNFLSKGFQGPYSGIITAVKELQSKAGSKGKVVKDIYFWYTTCPGCVSDPKNHKTVVFARIE